MSSTTSIPPPTGPVATGPGPGGTGPGPAPGAGGGGRNRRRRTIAVAVVIALAAVLAGAYLWAARDTGTETPATTTVTSPPATTAAPTTVTTTAPSTVAPPAPVDTATAVFPWASSAARYHDPVAVARAFAVDFVGFTDPLVGAYQAGDSRSGEVPVRPEATGPVTTVIVRQLGTDGTWWVLGSATESIRVATPTAGATIASPLTTTGAAVAFEGTVAVQVRQDGTRDPIGTGVVTGGGDVMRPFSGRITFPPPVGGHGAVLYLTHSAKDGHVWAASVLRVRFATPAAGA